jgi:hypothetical protein
VTRRVWNRAAKLLSAVAIAAVAASLVFGQVRQAEATRRDQAGVARMTEKMKTICVGRFLIDMPEEAIVELAGPRIHGLDIAAFSETADEFQARLAEREAQIKAKPDRFGGNRNLEMAREVATESGLTGKIFVHSRAVTEGTAANGLGLKHYRYEGVAVQALVHGHGVSVDMGSDYYFPDRVGNLSKLVNQLVPNPGIKVPKEPGFCIDHAYFRDPPKADQREQVRMFARLPSNPDIQFAFIVMAGTKPEAKGLLERNAESNGRLSTKEKARISKLRAEPRTIGGIAGEEVAERIDEANHAIVYSFWWEVNGAADNVMNPQLSFTMDSGKGGIGPLPSPLSQGAAVGLWKKISSSIRFYHAGPGTNAKTTAPTSASASALASKSRAPDV